MPFQRFPRRRPIAVVVARVPVPRGLLLGLLLGLGALSGSAGALAQTTPPPIPEQASPDQKAALTAVARMTEGQRTYFQSNGRFRAAVATIQQDFGFTLPARFDSAVRTTTEAAYSYVIPAQGPTVAQRHAYVGGTFLTPNQTPKLITIICRHNQPGQFRPADPQLVLGTLVDNPKGRVLRCGDNSTEVPASVLNE
ncbi:hypothetical protein KBY88_11330 [Cyanobium sp. Morenito 9A2]|nr:hypothetical protein [Cyanobium sp. Morenito 9A2]